VNVSSPLLLEDPLLFLPINLIGAVCPQAELNEAYRGAASNG